MNARDLLAVIGDVHGASWSDVARSLRVSTQTLRAWRTGNDRPSRGHELTISALLAEMTLLAEAGVADPGSWPFQAVVSGYTLTPHIALKRGVDIVDLVRADDTQEFLDAHLPGWRQEFWTDYKVVPYGDDGETAIVLKSVEARAVHGWAHR
jgi:hypothetical protein